MTRVAPILLVLASLALGGCALRLPGPASRSAASSPRCHPSQYWDGSQCRHKGKGHGARKHDGR